jgi:hypothetical protein
VDDVPERLKRDLGLTLWQRVSCSVDLADLEDAADLELDVLLGTLGWLLDLALDEHGCASGSEARERVNDCVDDDLERDGAGAVAELKEGEGALPLLPARPNPATDHDAVTRARGARGQDVADTGARGGRLEAFAEGDRGHFRRGGVGGHGWVSGSLRGWVAAAREVDEASEES